jgi:hypothetical protein
MVTGTMGSANVNPNKQTQKKRKGVYTKEKGSRGELVRQELGMIKEI